MVQRLLIRIAYTGLILLTSWGVTPFKASAQKFSIGAKAAPLISWMSFGDKDDKDDFSFRPKVGYYGAVFISFPLSKHYDCLIEGGFSQKGRHIRFNEGFSKNVATYYFADAALLLRKSYQLNILTGVPATWFFNVGPHISYWLDGKGATGGVDNDGSSYKIAFDKPFDPSDFNTMYLNDVNRWIFGLDIGVGTKAPIRRTTSLTVELRFTWGHTFYGSKTSSSYSWVSFQDNLRANERVLALSVAYSLDKDIRQGKMGKSTKDKEVKRKPIKRKRH